MHIHIRVHDRYSAAAQTMSDCQRFFLKDRKLSKWPLFRKKEKKGEKVRP